MGLSQIGKRPLLSEEMEFMGNPSKRIRLDLPNNKFDENVGNDDLWGSDDADITAEEFDRLEFQATQAQYQTVDELETSCRPTKSDEKTNDVSALQAETMKQRQYELEGKLKILTESLEQVSKELKEEKLNRDKIVGQRMKEFQQKEVHMRKEFQKIESALQFKNQEMKTVYDKVNLLETQLKEKSEQSEAKLHKSPKKFKKFEFEADKFPATSNKQSFVSESVKPSRKYQLLIDRPGGVTQGTEILSTILCNRLVISPSSSSSNPSCSSSTETSPQLSAMSIIRLNNMESEDIFNHITCVLKNYLTCLKNIASENSSKSYKKQVVHPNTATVISCLKDFTSIVSYPELASVMNRGSENRMNLRREEIPSTSHSSVSCNEQSFEKIHSLVQLLVGLSNPDSYPSGFLKTEEIEWSLAALVSWSSTSPEILLNFAGEIPFSSLITNHPTITSACMIVKFVGNLCIYKEFLLSLVHTNDTCILCTLATMMLQKISSGPEEYINVMLVIEDLLSSLFASYSFSELKLSTSPCASNVLQGVVTSLWNFSKIYRVDSLKVELVLKKGFALLHLLSQCLPDFKGRRTTFEEEYISLVCQMLTLSKENPEFKVFYDLIQYLWDFQEDTSELDLDELSDDSPSTGDSFIAKNI